MIKRIIVAGILCFFATSSFAQQIAIDFNKNKDQDQVSPKVREKMDEFQLKIKDIVNEEKSKLDTEIAKIDQDLEAKKITRAEADAMKLKLAEQSSEVINQRIEAVNFNLDDLIKKQVAFSILNGDKDPMALETNAELSKKRKPSHNLGLYVGYGFMGFSDKSDEGLKNHLGFANNTELGVAYEKQLSLTSPLSFRSGLFMSWRTTRLEDNYKFVRLDDGSTNIELSDVNLDKSKLRGSYLMLPVGLKYSFGKKIDVEGGVPYYKESKFSIAANGYAGVNLTSNNIYKGDDVKRRDKRDYNLNQFVYGAQLTFSYDSWSVYARKEFSNYYESNSFDARQMFQFGIAYGL